MTDNSRRDTYIHGNLDKLTTIGTVQGNVLIVNEKAIKDNLGRIQGALSSRHLYPVENVSDYIKVIIKSNRFGRKIQLQVPQGMTIKALIDFEVDLLGLPWRKSLDELMISFNFRYYVVYQGKKVPLNKTLRDANIHDGAELELSIVAIWTDEVEEVEGVEAKNGLSVMYEIGGRMQQLATREAARKARGVITTSKIKSWANSFFTFVDELGELTKGNEANSH